jgi:hypothetical protein
MTTTNKALITPAHGSYVDIWDQPVNQDWATLDKALGSSFSVTLETGSFTLSPAVITQANAVNQQLLVTGTLTGPWVILLPQNVGGAWIVNNNTSGPYTVTIGIGVTVPVGQTLVLQQSARSFIYTDGTSGDVYYGNDRSTGSGATGAGGDQIFFLNGQEVTTSYLIPSGNNAMTAGPIVIDSGATVTVQSNQTWTIV